MLKSAPLWLLHANFPCCCTDSGSHVIAFSRSYGQLKFRSKQPDLSVRLSRVRATATKLPIHPVRWLQIDLQMAALGSS